MTDVSQRVWPRQALVAHKSQYFRSPAQRWTFKLDQYLTDAEFAEHFVPADRLDRLLAAVERYLIIQAESTLADLRAAWRAYNEPPE